MHKSKDKNLKPRGWRTSASLRPHARVAHTHLCFDASVKTKHLRNQTSEKQSLGLRCVWCWMKLFPESFEGENLPRDTRSPSTATLSLLRPWVHKSGLNAPGSRLEDGVSTPASELNTPQSPSLWKTVCSVNADAGSAHFEHQGLENSLERMFSQKN